MRAVGIEVLREVAQNSLKMSAAHDQGPVQALGADGAHPALRVCVGVRSPDRRTHDPDAFRLEYRIEGAGELRLGTRRVHIAGATRSPDSASVTQQARNVAATLDEQGTSLRFLIRDRDAKFTRSFDAVFEAEGIRIVCTL